MHDALRKAEEERARRRGELPQSPGGGGRSDSSRRDPVKSEAPTVEIPRKTESPRAKEAAREKAAPRGLRSLLPTDAVARDRVGPDPVELEGVAPDFRLRGVSDLIVTHHRPNDLRAEQFRAIKSNLRALRPEPHTICFTSSRDNEGTAPVCVNVACAFAEEQDVEILIVDANLRGSHMAEILGLDSGAAGLAEVLSGAAGPLDVVQRTAIPNVFCVLDGRHRANPGGLLSSRRLSEALAAWRQQFDRVLLDAPAIVGVNDAAVVGHQVDASALVIKLGSTPRELVDRSLAILRGAGTRVVGCIVTNAEAAQLVSAEG